LLDHAWFWKCQTALRPGSGSTSGLHALSGPSPHSPTSYFLSPNS
jgi:hypothetical protein